MPPFEYHKTPPGRSCCCLGLSRKGALPKPWGWGSSSVAVLETELQSWAEEPGYQSCSPSAAGPWGVTSSRNFQDCSVPGKLPWPGFLNAGPRDRQYRACPAQRTPLLSCSYSSGTQSHTQILSKGRNTSAKDTSREALNCNRMGSAQSGASCWFCTPVGKRIHSHLFPEAKLSNGALPRLLKGK